MKSKKTFLRASKALALASLVVVVLAGCGKKEEVADVAAPATYMKDKAFMGKLAEQDQTKRAIMKRFAELKRAYEAECAKDPNGAAAKELKAKMDATEDEFQENRKVTQAIVRERLTRKTDLKK